MDCIKINVLQGIAYNIKTALINKYTAQEEKKYSIRQSMPLMEFNSIQLFI